MRTGAPSFERTIETRLEDRASFAVIDQVLDTFASLRHRLFRDLIIQGKAINELKSAYIGDFHITARHFNSLAFEVKGLAESSEALKKDRIHDLGLKISSLEKQVKKLEKRLKDNQALLEKIAHYRQKLATWKADGKKRKKPAQPPAIRHVFREKIEQEQRRTLSSLHQKKRRLGNLNDKRERLMQQSVPSICFGSRAFFQHQWNLEKAGFHSHDEWHEAFLARRSSHVFFVGSSDESAGNQTVQYDPELKTLTLRLPTSEAFASHGKFLTIQNVEFPEHLYQEFLAALSPPLDTARKNQKTRQPISYRLVRRINDNTGLRAYYLQATFVPEAPAIQTRAELGVIGMDLNADHLAIAETDRFGNLVDSFSLPFHFTGLESGQTEALIGDLSASVIKHCLERGKPLAVELLDFKDKKSTLRSAHLEQRKMLSAFAYAAFKQRLESKSRALGVELLEVNPAYTSLIGAFKFQGLAISTHEKAAFVMARRSRNFSEDLEIFQGTRPAHAMMQERTDFRASPRHVWGFYADHQRKIRDLFMSEKKRPLYPSIRALSLAREHPSLLRSYESPSGRYRVILDRQNSGALHRVSGGVGPEASRSASN